jgi:hypothetical protein
MVRRLWNSLARNKTGMLRRRRLVMSYPPNVWSIVQMITGRDRTEREKDR